MNTLLIAIALAAVIFILERLKPAVALPNVSSWYLRAAVFNGIQVVIAFSSAQLWDQWFARLSLVSLQHWPLAGQVAVGYLTITFVYYWWHRARHSVPLLWRYLHQFHHSPQRIEVITSFYKHPLEVVLNGMLTSALLYILLGLSAPAVALCVMVTAIAELLYHMNIRTPQLLGRFFQRPEMHRIHHQRGLHHYNFSDLPVWDMLFGTYRNPAQLSNETGFPDANELKLLALLKGQELES